MTIDSKLTWKQYIVKKLWKPPTKQFYPKCQSPTVLPSSKSTCRIAVPSCIGSRPASRQSKRDARPERQSQWSSNTTRRNGQVTTGLHLQTTSLSQLTTRTSASRHGHQDEPARSPPGRDSHALPSVQCSDGTLQGQHERSVRVRDPTLASLLIPSRAATGPSRSTRSFSACACTHKTKRSQHHNQTIKLASTQKIKSSDWK
jgi:hypothetical protein